MRQVLTEIPRSYHASEDIHEQREIDEASVEADVGDIADPDLIATTDIKGLQAILPRLPTLSGVGRLTRTFDSDREIGFFHQPGDALIPNGGPFSHQQLRDTSISVCWIGRS